MSIATQKHFQPIDLKEVFAMSEPKPSAAYGAWRKKSVKCLGHNLIPASVTPADREIVNSRQKKKVTNDECNPDSD